MIHFLLSFFKAKAHLELEIIFLRKQLEILNRTNKKFQIRNRDRVFFVFMKSIFNRWRESLIIIKPEAVIKWHRKGFHIYLRWKSKNDAGRPRVPKKQIELTKRISNENPLWGVPHIHAEILKLGYDISQVTVWRYIPKKNDRTNG
jgi:hypothetical protein